MTRLRKNIAYNFLGQGLLLILGFVAVKYVFKQLGEDALGIIYFSLTMNAVLGAMLEMGICTTTIREVSAYFEKDPAYIRDLIRTASLCYWSTYGLLAAAVWLGAPYIVEKWIILKTLDPETANRALQILVVGALLGLPRALYVSLFRGLQRMEFNNLIDIVTMGFQQLGTIVILVMGGSLLQVTYWLAAGFALGVLIYLFASTRFVSWSALVPGYSFKVIQRNLHFSANMTSISILAIIHTHGDKVIISKLLPLGTLGYYSFLYSLLARMSLLTGAISQAVFPSFSSLASGGDQGRLISQYRKFQNIVCLSTVPLYAAIPFATPPLLAFLFNAEIARDLLLPAVLLSVGFYMNGAMAIPYMLSLAVGKPEISSKSNFLALFVVLPATGVLIYFGGLAGAGLSWIFYHIFAYSYAVPRICSECLFMPVWEWYAHILKIVVLASLTYGAAWLLVASVGAYTVGELGMAYILGSAAFLIGAYRWIDGEQRGFLDTAAASLMKLLPL
jgi:O-antigen/teichoic acid export membrane protein